MMDSNREDGPSGVTRRQFCRAVGLGLAASFLVPNRAFAAPGPLSKDVWIWSDAHISKRIDGRDGAEWLRIAINDTANVCNPAYTLALGDITHGGARKHLAAYNKLRKELRAKHHMSEWYEIVGNHDWKGVETGDYQELVRREGSFCIEDGNLIWIMISAERSWSRGIINAEKQKWLEQIVAANQHRNIFVCTHQTVASTVRLTNPDEKYDMGRILTPIDWIEGLLKRYKIDAWFSGHEHGNKRDKDMIKRVGNTTFINVASVSHVYGTKAMDSFFLQLKNGAKTVPARCREHDKKRFRSSEFNTVIPLRFPLQLAKREKLTHIQKLPVPAPVR